ncbi:unnamed protein product [Allacma fusca]|uniref:Uncharacterized protein n=1 Tax=Allacma fusca TaxID=39272 RepID=A0A8J2LMN7_9HEXA|nr:unnamed protein product [Allacma fusca]
MEAVTKRPPKPNKFLASTPAVSPSQRFKYDGEVPTTANHRVPADDVNHDRTFLDSRRNPATPVRVGTGHAEAQTQLHLSPIDRLEEDRLIYTLVHRGENDTTLPVTTAVRTGNLRAGFPFPTPHCMKRAPRDKYESLLEGLQLLKCLESIQDNDGIPEQQDFSSTMGRKNTNVNVVQAQKNFEFTEVRPS